MNWIPVRPWSLLFICTVPGNAKPGWTHELFTPDGSGVFTTRGQMPFAFAPVTARMVLAPAKSETIVRPARLKAIAARLSLSFGTTFEESRVGLLDIPTILVDASVPPGLIDHPDEIGERKAAAALFPIGRCHEDELLWDTNDAEPIRVLDKLTSYEMKLRAEHGLLDCPDLQAILTLMGHECERRP